MGPGTMSNLTTVLVVTSSLSARAAMNVSWSNIPDLCSVVYDVLLKCRVLACVLVFETFRFTGSRFA